MSNSDILAQLYVKSAYRCKVEKSPKDCQALANLCVLNLYSQNRVSCALTEKLIQNRLTWKTPIPEIIYTDGLQPSRAQDVIERSNVLKFRAAFSNPYKDFDILTKLKFKIAIFDIYGNMLGTNKKRLFDLEDQIFLCEVLQENFDRLMTIGTTLIE